MNKNAKNALAFPQSNKSGTSVNSKIFMVAMMMICVQALKRGKMPLKIQTAITISEMPIAFVKIEAYDSPNIRDTIC